jgi:hypothetical protein
MAPLEKEPTGAVMGQASQDKKFQDALSLIEKDNKAKRCEYLFETPGFITRWVDKAIRDPRDKPMVFLMFNMVSPCVVLLFAIAHDGTPRIPPSRHKRRFSAQTLVLWLLARFRSN